MPLTEYCATMCAFRTSKNGEPEVLMVRRGYTTLDGGLQTFPGEPVFPGGKRDPFADRDMVYTAERETGEETGYTGPFADTKLLRSFYTQPNDSRWYFVEVYTTTIDPAFEPVKPSGTPTDEIIDIFWISPEEAYKKILSKEFYREAPLKV